MIAPRLLACVAHALLHNGPFAVVGDDEAMEVEIEAILHGCAIDFRHQPARFGERGSVESDAISEGYQLVRRLPGMLATAAANVDAELLLQRRQPPLQRTDHAGGDAGRMPVHAHDRAE